MKKIVALLLVLTLALSAAVVLAAASKGGEDYNNTKTEDENEFFFKVTDEGDKVEWANAELAKLKEAGDVGAYFGLADEIAAILGEGEYKVYEFAAVVAGNYDESMGEITANFPFATPYEKDTKVAVLLGFAAKDENGEAKMEWKPIEGGALEDGSIEFKVDPETITRVQEESALLAVVSK